jgi:hypothetical protein
MHLLRSGLIFSFVSLLSVHASAQIAPAPLPLDPPPEPAPAPGSNRTSIAGEIGWAEAGYWLGVLGGIPVGATAGYATGSTMTWNPDGPPTGLTTAMGIPVGAGLGAIVGAPAALALNTDARFGPTLLGSVAGTLPGAVAGSVLIYEGGHFDCLRKTRGGGCARYASHPDWTPIGATLIAVWSQVGIVGGSVAAAELSRPHVDAPKHDAFSITPAAGLAGRRPYFGLGGEF